MSDEFPVIHLRSDGPLVAMRRSDYEAMTAELDSLRADVKRFRSHSVLLNKVAWHLHDAMGTFPADADTHEGDIEADLPAICAQLRAARAVRAELAVALSAMSRMRPPNDPLRPGDIIAARRGGSWTTHTHCDCWPDGACCVCGADGDEVTG